MLLFPFIPLWIICGGKTNPAEGMDEPIRIEHCILFSLELYRILFYYYSIIIIKICEIFFDFDSCNF